MLLENDIVLNLICIHKQQKIWQTPRFRLAVPQSNFKHHLEWFWKTSFRELPVKGRQCTLGHIDDISS